MTTSFPITAILSVLFIGFPAAAFAQQSAEAAPEKIETRLGTLKYEAGFPTPETVGRLYDEFDYQRAVLAYHMVDNLVSFYSMDVGFQAAGAN